MNDAAEILDYSFDAPPDPDQFVQAAMKWHFTPETGSPFWLDRRTKLDFDPLADIKSFDDLRLFPNVVDDLRTARVSDLVPRGYGAHPDVVGVFESGGTTGAPKRIVFLRDWLNRALTISTREFAGHGVFPGGNWLALMPGRPHMVGGFSDHEAVHMGGLKFSIDMDPRWVKKLIAADDPGGAAAYSEHLVEQATHVLESQDVSVLLLSPPMLDRIAGRPDLVDLIKAKVEVIIWGGTHMDAESRFFYRTELFPDKKIIGAYGSTTFLGAAKERPGLSADDMCVFDSSSLHLTFSVVDADTGRSVEPGARGRVLVNHISKAMLLPNNLERDTALRCAPLSGQPGDAVAAVEPTASHDGEDVIEGVY
ncbi:phenazine antibiotic biosynthesis protein [Amycolatopsis orientalis]|uniref:Phenazine antibiotic biosynthesis protein n=1 Tax=Amycolatopsis orientalis TaxID=31958 RepID=A0A193BUG7_AMYOR|nr:phenazine antibiotic biosynthesis protein [Amycolatopsis orientalis]ANN15818.1 phenazine antibiotic biosynthesis protein [Amycolatopsis orientalis]